MLQAVQILRDPARVQEQLVRFEQLLIAPFFKWLRVPVEPLVEALVKAGEAAGSEGEPPFPRSLARRFEQAAFAPGFVKRLVQLSLGRDHSDADRVTVFVAYDWFLPERQGADAADAAWAAVLLRTIRDDAGALFATLARRAARVEPDELRRSLVEARTPAAELEQLVRGLQNADDLALELDPDLVVGQPAHLLQAAERFASESVDELCSAGLTPRLHAEALSRFDEALALDADAAALERLRARLEADLAALDAERAALARGEADDGEHLGRLEPGELDVLRLELLAALASLSALEPVRNPLLRSLYSRALLSAFDEAWVDVEGLEDDGCEDDDDDSGGAPRGSPSPVW